MVLDGKASPRSIPWRRPPQNGDALQADPISAVCDHDFAEMPATFEMAVCLLRLGKRERPIDHGAQAVHRNCPVHGLEIDPTSDADRTERKFRGRSAIKDQGPPRTSRG